MNNSIKRTKKKDFQTGGASGGGGEVTLVQMNAAIALAVDDKITGDGVKKITLGNVPPVSPDVGDIWINKN